MGIEFLIKGIIIGLSVSIPLGPIGVIVIQRTLSKGRLSGFISGVGAGSADIIYSIFAGLGITFIIDIITKYSVEFQIFGGIFLVLLGIQLFFKNPIKQFRQPKTKGGLIGDYLSTFFLTITNPIALFLFIGVFAAIGFIDTKFENFTLGYIVAGVAIGTTLWWFVLSTLINLFRSKIRLRKLNWINKISGVIIFICGVFAIINQVITLF